MPATPAIAIDRPPIEWMSAAGKGLAFIGLALLVGFFVFRLWIVQIPTNMLPRWMPIGGVLGGAVHVVGLLIFLVAEAANTNNGPWEYAVETAFGRGLLVRIGLGFVAQFALLVEQRSNRMGSGVWAAGPTAAAVATAAYFSHTAALAPLRALGTAIDAAHLLGATAWAGGLVFLFLSLRQNRDGVESGRLALFIQTSERFSRLAQTSVVLLTVTGVAMLVTVLGPNPLSWLTQARSLYGILLAYKIALAFVMMGLGAVNHYYFVRRYLRNERITSVNLFRANVRREVVNGILILAVAALVTTLAPITSVPVG